ncbi:hypothetical protein GGQ98_003601 [Sphingosinicella soli]|uniref:Uncharacterized protein n=1 Tax=Sphingosinicella soli TaxID=333708 RepID=A0A7W7B4M8_9SPHN|nr:hypothetical protein [Sphingosinicella soli]
MTMRRRLSHVGHLAITKHRSFLRPTRFLATYRVVRRTCKDTRFSTGTKVPQSAGISRQSGRLVSSKQGLRICAEEYL